jgi:hypothetical protein
MTGIAIGSAFLLGAAAGGWGCLAVGVAAVTLAVARAQRRLVLSCLIVVGAGALGALRGAALPTIGAPSWVDGATAIMGRW